jgi:hypothetical protein
VTFAYSTFEFVSLRFYSSWLHLVNGCLRLVHVDELWVFIVLTCMIMFSLYLIIVYSTFRSSVNSHLSSGSCREDASFSML